MVTPYLRPMNNPPFGTIGEALDFIDQSVRHHPVRLHYAPNNAHNASSLLRIDNPVRYYYIDFGISYRFKEGSKPMLLGRKGRNQQVPELSATVPYDAFEVDVYALGDVFAKEFVEVDKYYGLEKLQPLVDAMKRPNPPERVSAKDALTQFQDIRAKGFSGYPFPSRSR
ncbi:hypothetical protein C8Q74DRAFT_1366062 [Fomes fomentarius]|nr:hypothetical protein C8Q74DRAFT_1366062 [Fomes fomentarius]